MKPIMNIDEVQISHSQENGLFTFRRGKISDEIGARKIGYNLTILPPGKAQCTFHSHRHEEEMFLILEGDGELRFGDKRYPIRQNDIIACPTGGHEVAHQIINTGSQELRYLAISTVENLEVCEYPDSGKIGIYEGPRGQTNLIKLFRTEDEVDYYRGETSSPKPESSQT
ncbi:MAG: cupin domain-containing protein [Roseibium sp.]|nr:cupin domain-containing protein [Roseibium sp.]